MREEGEKVAREILPQLRKRGSRKLITKVNARRIYERLNRRIPVQVFNFKDFTKSKGRRVFLDWVRCCPKEIRFFHSYPQRWITGNLMKRR